MHKFLLCFFLVLILLVSANAQGNYEVMLNRPDITGLTGGGSTNLDGIPTRGLAVGTNMIIFDGSETRIYRLTAGTDAENPPGIIRPDDFASPSNEKVWKASLSSDPTEVGYSEDWAQTGGYLYPANTDWDVGIGNTAPAEKLDVTGNIKASGDITSGSSIKIDGTTNPGTITETNGSISFDDEDLVTAGEVEMGAFQLTTSPSNGYVLTSDDNGVGTWTDPEALAIVDDYMSGEAAGGDLTGNYPNPELGTSVVSDNEMDYTNVTLSDFTNDGNYLVVDDNVSDLTNDANYLATGDNVSDLTNDAGYITEADDDYMSGEAAGGDLTGNYPNPELGTGVVSDNEMDYTNVTIGDFTNDAGYITDPDDQDWDIDRSGANRKLYTHSTDDSVGIGTGTPSEKLDVEGNIYASGTVQSGSSISIDGTTNPGTITETNGKISFDDEDLVTTGDVGIGTDAPTSKLDVRGVITGDDNIVISSTSNKGLTIERGGGGNNITGRVEIDTPSGLEQLNINTSNGDIEVQANGNDNQFFLDEDGNVGIGNAAPQEKLDVNGTVEMTGLKLTTSPTSGYVLTSDADGLGSWTNPTTLPADSDWTISTSIGDGTNDVTLVTNGKWGLFREGNTGYGNACSTHVNLGVGSITGQTSQNRKYAVVSGGHSNEASHSYSTVSGGNSNTASGIYSTISGGNSNTATSNSAIVTGGYNNTASADYSFVGGGSTNEASGVYTTVGGGFSNTATVNYSTVGGGFNNHATSTVTTVGGGLQNNATNEYTTVSGGQRNKASGTHSTVGGGLFHWANGSYSAIPGGARDTISGELSMAFGYRARANLDKMVIFDWYGSTDGALFVEYRPAIGEDSLRNNYSIVAGHNSKVYGDLKVTGTVTSGSSIRIDGTTNPGTITETNGSISFDDEDLVTTGEVKMGAFKLTASPTNGYVLTSDADGVGSWANPATLYDDDWDVDRTGSKRRITTHSTGDSVVIGNVILPSSKLDVNGDINVSGTYKILTSTVFSVEGTQNLFAGLSAGANNSGGQRLTAVGTEALVSNVSGSDNTAVGMDALYTNSSGYKNTANGTYALYSNNDGYENTASGYTSMLFNTSGYANSAYGTQTLYNNTNACRNVAVGSNALYTQSYGGGSAWNSDNVAIGHSALYSNQPVSDASGHQNTAVGNFALYSNTSAPFNAGLGYQAGYHNMTGYSNVFLGAEAGFGTSGQSQNSNVIVGYRAGYSINSSSNANVFIGFMAGYNETGANKLYIENSNSASPLIYGDFAKDTLVFNGAVGIKRTPTGNDLEVEGTASKTAAGDWLANSDRRIKTDIKPIQNALETINKINLVSFRYNDEYKAQHPNIEDRNYHNVIAQEFQKVFPDYVKGSGEYLKTGEEILQVDSYPLTIYTAVAVQELSRQNEELRAENENLRIRLEKIEKIMGSGNK